MDACDIFERVAPTLKGRDVLFKAPSSIDDLLKINSGVFHSYSQIGKFITVYPKSDQQAQALAEILHELTLEYDPIKIPFDQQYLENSSVFYRYGAFDRIERFDDEGRSIFVIRRADGHEEADDRFRSAPEWVENIFENKHPKSVSFDGTPLEQRYRVFDAVSQRGKGGLYLAFDTHSPTPRLAIVKEGRKQGELAWNGQDGRQLAENEYKVLKALKQDFEDVPEVCDSFELNGSFYFLMEFIKGDSLKRKMDLRQRRYSIRKIIEIGVEIAQVLEKIHAAGWVWNDCKPSNLILTPAGTYRPIDFEGAYRIGELDPYNWRSKAFSTDFDGSEGVYADLFSLGSVLYFLVTGQLYDPEKPSWITKLRRRVPPELVDIVNRLLSDRDVVLSEIISRLSELSRCRIR